MPNRPRTVPVSHAMVISQQSISPLQQEEFPHLERIRQGAQVQAKNQDGTNGASLAADGLLRRNQEPSVSSSKAINEEHFCGLFHAHAHDMSCLAQWLEEILDLRASKYSSGQKEGLTSFYREKAIRYGIVFDELVRQITVHSKDLARLVAMAFAGQRAILDQLIKVHDAHQGKVKRLETELEALTRVSNRKLHEEDALIEEKQFAEKLMKAELRESRALCSSMRVKLNFYEDEIARLRQVVLQELDEDEGDGSEKFAHVHNSLTTDGLSIPVHTRLKKTDSVAPEGDKKDIHQEMSETELPEGVVTILALTNERVDMHLRHEREMSRLLTQLSAEHSKQAKDTEALGRLIESIEFDLLVRGVSRETSRLSKRTRETQTRPYQGQGQGQGQGPGDGSRPSTPSGKKKAPRKVKGSKSEMLPLDLRMKVGMTSAPNKVPTLGYMLRTALDLMVVWSRSMHTVSAACSRIGGMTEIAIKHFQLLHGMENTTNVMLAQFTAGLVHFADYKRCKVLGDLLGVYDVTQPPPLDHHAALFLFRLVAELKSVGVLADETQRERIAKVLLNKLKAEKAVRTILGPLLPHGSSPLPVLIPCLEDSGISLGMRESIPGERVKRTRQSIMELPIAKQMVEFDVLLPEAISAWSLVMKHRVAHIHLAFHRYCSTFQVCEEMRFAMDESPRARDAVIMQLSKTLTDRRRRRQLYSPPSVESEGEGEGEGEDGTFAETTSSARWILEGDGEATCSKDFESMNSPVVELMVKEDLALAVKYLNPSLTDSDVAVLFEQGCNIMWDNTKALFTGLWAPEETDGGKKYWMHTILDRTQWTPPFNIDDFKRQELDRKAFVELCLSERVLDDSPLAREFLGAPELLWDEWDDIVTSLGKKENEGNFAIVEGHSAFETGTAAMATGTGHMAFGTALTGPRFKSRRSVSLSVYSRVGGIAAAGGASPSAGAGAGGRVAAAGGGGEKDRAG